MNNKRPLRGFLALGVVAAVAVASGCGEDGGGRSGRTPAADATQASVPAGARRATLHGTLTLDGAPFDAQFLGVRVARDGLSAACQAGIPPVTDGRYQVGVVADDEVRGCGAPDAEVLLWVHDGERFLFSNERVLWPGDGAEATFDASFSSARPLGASRPVTELKGHLFARDGAELPAGTVVEAYAGETRCGVTSLRPREETEGYYTIVVAGPDDVPACAEGATLTFRLDGAPAEQTAVHDLNRTPGERELDLTLR
jgi:hypothetical protein